MHLERDLALAGVPHVAIRDEDLQGRLVAIGLVPGPKAKLKPYVRRYPLLKEVP